MDTNLIIRKAKSNLLLRALFWPYMTLKKKKAYDSYQKSNEGKKLCELENIYNGERCFIIGNGSSLKSEDLDKIKNEISFGSNRIYNMFGYTEWRPTFYIAEDEDAYAEMIPKVLSTSIKKFILSPSAVPYEGDRHDDVYHALWTNMRYVINRYNDKSIHFSKDISNHISDGYTVTFSAIQIAAYMGFKQLYLLGVDFNYSKITDKFGRIKKIDGATTYFDGVERNGSYLNYHSTMIAYNTAKRYCENNGIVIKNATRGGKLEIFERVNFDELFK